MRACPKCNSVIFTGGTDCARCGYVLRPDDPVLPVLQAARSESSPLLSNPQFPQYRQPPEWLPVFMAIVGLVFAAIGVFTALTPGPASCHGRSGVLCLVATAASEAILGTANARLADASLWIAFALLCFALAWHTHSMWFKKPK